MSNVLLIHSSIFGAQSQSLALAREFVTRFPTASVVERTLTPETMPHLTGETMAAMATPEAQRSERQKELVALADKLIAEIDAADTIASTERFRPALLDPTLTDKLLLLAGEAID